MILLPQEREADMFNVDPIPGRTCIIDGKEYLFFSGYSYLGMSHIPAFVDSLIQGTKKYGSVFPSSRNSNTRLSLYEEFENELALLTGMAGTVSYSSGYLAGLAISTVLSEYSNIEIAPCTHPAIANMLKGDKISQRNEDQSFDHWANKVTARINDSNQTTFVLVADSVNILANTLHDFTFINRINEEKEIIFLIDDSHGLGILGDKGEGISANLPMKAGIDYILCYSLSKAFNLIGGAISASRYWCDLLRTQSPYSASTAISPSQIFTFLQSRKLYLQQQQLLRRNIDLFYRSLPKKTFNVQPPVLPIMLCRNSNAQNIFKEQGMIISSFSYPLPLSEKINRVILNALHEPEDIVEIVSVFNHHHM